MVVNIQNNEEIENMESEQQGLENDLADKENILEEKENHIIRITGVYRGVVDGLNKDLNETKTENEELEATKRRFYDWINHVQCNEPIKRPDRYLNTFEVCNNGCDYWIDCTGSMRPTFSCEDTLIVYTPREDDIGLCDIIGFKTPEHPQYVFIVHRIIAFDGDEYITKGDNFLIDDGFSVDFDDVIFKVVGIEYGQ